jgi:hypothetical protein
MHSIALARSSAAAHGSDVKDLALERSMGIGSFSHERGSDLIIGHNEEVTRSSSKVSSKGLISTSLWPTL